MQQAYWGEHMQHILHNNNNNNNAKVNLEIYGHVEPVGKHSQRKTLSVEKHAQFENFPIVKGIRRDVVKKKTLCMIRIDRDK